MKMAWLRDVPHQRLVCMPTTTYIVGDLETKVMQRKILICVALLAVIAFFHSNRASAQTCEKNIPQINGTCVTLPYQMPINPISTTLQATGKVVIVSGSESDAWNNSKGAESYRAAVWGGRAACGPGALLHHNRMPSAYVVDRITPSSPDGP